MSKLERTEFFLEQVKSHLLSFGRSTPQIENFLAQYLTVTFYAEMEKYVAGIYSKRIAKNADKRVRYFAESSAKNWPRLVPKSDIAKLALCFGEDCKKNFNASLEDKDVSLYSTIITSRHAATHGNGGNVTINQIEEALEAASNILEELEKAIE